MKVKLCAFLTTAMDEGYWSALLSGCFTTREFVPGAHCIVGLVGPRADVDMMDENSSLSENRIPVVQPIASHFTD